MKQMPDLPYWSIPIDCWRGDTVALLGGGPSLTTEQVEHVRVMPGCHVVAINRAFQLAPWADWIWGCDADLTRFWGLHPEAADCPGTRIAVRGTHSVKPSTWRNLDRLVGEGVKVIMHSSRDYPARTTHYEGASADPAVVRGNNSLFQILSVITHTGAATVLLLGADMYGGHWHAGYQGHSASNFAGNVIPKFQSLVKPLADAGVEVLNCTPGSKLPWWPMVDLQAERAA